MVNGKTQPLYGVLIESTSSFHGEGKIKKKRNLLHIKILFLPTVKEGREFWGKMINLKMHRFETKYMSG